MNQKERVKTTVRFTVLMIAAGLVAVLFVMRGPLDMSCKFYRITGYSCPGCGATRMVEAIFAGELYQAFRYNSFLFLSVPVIGVLYTIGAYRYIKFRASNDWVMVALMSYAILLAGFGILRNVPLFQWLLPTIIY